MVFDNLCSCRSDPLDTIPTSLSTDTSSSKKSYFDDTILRSDPKVDRSPTKISSTRWEALRAVVASHGDYSVQDYCDLYEKPVESMPPIEESKEDITANNSANSIYPTKEPKNTRSLMDDVDEEMQIPEDDDIREEPCDQDLHTCQSFDHYVVEPSKRFLCASPSTPTRATVGVPLSPPTTRLPDRRRSRQISAAQISPRTLGFQMHNNGQRLTPPSPAPSAADTYTTISLSQSFAREFDEDDDFQLYEPAGGNLFLDRLAAETISQSPSRSPFRRLRPRTCHEDEKKEEEEDRPSTPTKKRSSEEDNDEQYRCLVRMSPDNYKHGKTSSDWFEEFPKPESCASSVSSSVLLPLHPHQRIMEPLSDMEESGYSFFRDHPHNNKRRITVG